jgi:hypothetical protein
MVDGADAGVQRNSWFHNPSRNLMLVGVVNIELAAVHFRLHKQMIVKPANLKKPAEGEVSAGRGKLLNNWANVAGAHSVAVACLLAAEECTTVRTL